MKLLVLFAAACVAIIVGLTAYVVSSDWNDEPDRTCMDDAEGRTICIEVNP